MEARGAAVGPFCCAAAVCGACALYSDAEDCAFRSRQRLLHALERGEGRCAVRQYMRKTGQVYTKQQAQQSKELQQPAQAERHRQRWRAQQPQASASCSRSAETSARGCRGVHAGAGNGPCVEPAAGDADSCNGTSEAHARRGREDAQAPTAHEGQQASGAAFKAAADRTRSLCWCRTTRTDGGTACREPASFPTGAHVCSTSTTRASDPTAEGAALLCSVGSPAAGAARDSKAVTAAAAAVSERCTRWRVLQLAAHAAQDTRNVPGESERRERLCLSEGGARTGSPREAAAFRPPDVLLACTDYLLRCLLPSVVFPPTRGDDADILASALQASPAHAASEAARGGAAAAKLPAAAAPPRTSPAATGGRTGVDPRAAHREALPGSPRGDAAAPLSRSASCHQDRQQQQQAMLISAGERPLCGTLPASPRSECCCLCHRYGRDCNESVGAGASLREDESRALFSPNGDMQHVPPPITAGPASASTVSSAGACSFACPPGDPCAEGDVAAITPLAGDDGFSAASCGPRAAATVPDAAAAAAAAGYGVYSFFADRLRALRQEAVLEHLLHRPLYFLLLLQSTRYHLFADLFWGGSLFSSNPATCTHLSAPATAGPPLREPSDSSLSVEAAATMPERLQLQEQLVYRPSCPGQPWFRRDRTTRRAEGDASASSTGVAGDSSRGGTPSTSSSTGAARLLSVMSGSTAAATLLEKAGFSASLNRLLLASCMQQLLNFIISTARRFFLRQQRVRRRQQERRTTIEGRRQGCTAADARGAAGKPEGMGGSSTCHRDVPCQETSGSKQAFSAVFCSFASLLQVQPHDVDEIVACALLYLLLPREDTAVPHQAVQLLLQQTAAALKPWWRECRWTQYAARLVLLAAAGGAHHCLKELLILTTQRRESLPFFLQCAAYSHLDFLRAAVAVDIRAAAPLSSPGTRMALGRLQQLLQCTAAAALRLAQAAGATLQQQQQQGVTRQLAQHEQSQWAEEQQKPRQHGSRQDQQQREGAVSSTLSSLSSETAVIVYFCRGNPSPGGTPAQTRSTLKKQQHEQPHVAGGSGAAVGGHLREATRELPKSIFAGLQSDAWQHSLPPDTFAFPRSKTAFRSLFDWPTHYTPLRCNLYS